MLKKDNDMYIPDFWEYKYKYRDERFICQPLLFTKKKYYSVKIDTIWQRRDLFFLHTSENKYLPQYLRFKEQ